MQRPTSILVPLAATLLGLAACGSRVQTLDDGTGGRSGTGGGGGTSPRACDGALGQEPQVIARGLGPSFLIDGEDRIVIAERKTGRVLAIDRCTGDTSELAALASISGAVRRGDELVLVAGGDGGPLWRVPLDGGGATPLPADLPGGPTIAASGTDLYLKVSLATDPDDPDAPPAVGIYRLADGAQTPELLTRVVQYAPGATLSLVGATTAGAYYRESYDCGCNPVLHLVPRGGGPTNSLSATAGARAIAPVADRFVTFADLDPQGFGEVDVDIVRMALDGSAVEVLHDKDGVDTVDLRFIAADEQSACWAGFRGPPRCMRAVPGAPVRRVGAEDDTAAEALLLAGGVLSWLRPVPGSDGTGTDGAELELVVAVP